MNHLTAKLVDCLTAKLVVANLVKLRLTKFFSVVHNEKWVTGPCIPRINHTLFNVKKTSVCVYKVHTTGRLQICYRGSCLGAFNKMPKRVGWGLVLTVQNEIQLKPVQNEDSDQKTQQNHQNNATYMYSVRNERIMVTVLSPKSE